MIYIYLFLSFVYGSLGEAPPYAPIHDKYFQV